PAGLLEELRDVMRSAPSPMRPGRLYLIEAIPRLPSSKLDVRALTALDEANVRSERADVAVESRADAVESDGVAQTVARVWQALLHTPVSGADDDFFEAGGDSLKAITLMIELEQALDLELPVTLINQAPTFGRLCEALRNRGTSRYDPLVTLKAGAGLPA